MSIILNENMSCAAAPTTCNANEGLKCSPEMTSNLDLRGSSGSVDDRLCVKELQCDIMLKLQAEGQDLSNYNYVVYS